MVTLSPSGSEAVDKKDIDDPSPAVLGETETAENVGAWVMLMVELPAVSVLPELSVE